MAQFTVLIAQCAMVFISVMSIGHNGTVVCMLCPKISTSWEKLAQTGRHGRHVFATQVHSEICTLERRVNILECTHL